jgi:putative DNA primase/helicase
VAASYSEISDALHSIPPDLCRDDWWKIAAAIKNELGAGGFDLFNDWSHGADSYKSSDVRSTWNSTKPNGAGPSITVGTLFKMAQDHGHRPRTIACKRTSKPARRNVTGNAKSYWDQAEDCTGHPYAERKGLDTAGLKKYKGRLLIPAYNAAGDMSSLQKISKDGDKKFLAGCTMSGCWFTIAGDDVIVVAEGWATAQSIQMATGHTAVVAFSSSGFTKIPPLLRKKFPEARMILVPDNDESQDAIKKAKKAARKSGCEIIVPEVNDGTDFNDVHLSEGLEEVRHQFDHNASRPRLHDLVVVELKDVTPRSVEWLWPGKFALGKLVLLGGVPSTGKTTITHSIVSIVTTGGQWPFSHDQAPRGRAIILTCEDDLEDTVVPRLIATDADLKRVSVIQSVAGEAGDRQKPFMLANDLHQLEGLLKQHPDILLVVFDPLSAYLGAADSHRDTDVREVLGPLCQLAAQYKVTILGITHLNKNAANSAMARFMGSGGIIAAARAAYMTVSVDGTLMMLPVKNNLAPRDQASGLTYQIRTAQIGDGIETSVVEWTGEAEMWADEALAKIADSRRTTKLEAAKTFLQDILKDGPKRQAEIEEAATSEGHAFMTLKRARKKLEYLSKKDGYSSGWKWYTPEQWDNYVEVLQGKKQTEVDHLRGDEKSQKKTVIPPAKNNDLLRVKDKVKTGLKPTGSKGSTEGDHGPQKNAEVIVPKFPEKPPEDTKEIKSTCLGKVAANGTGSDDWGAV